MGFVKGEGYRFGGVEPIGAGGEAEGVVGDWGRGGDGGGEEGGEEGDEEEGSGFADGTVHGFFWWGWLHQIRGREMGGFGG